MRVAIVGSRFRGASQGLVARVLAEVAVAVATLGPDDILVSGGAAGVDSWAAEIAHNKYIVVEVRPAWDAHGKGAGHRRNVVICRMAERMVAIHDGSSKGTQHAIETMRRLGKPVEIIEVKP